MSSFGAVKFLRFPRNSLYFSFLTPAGVSNRHHRDSAYAVDFAPSADSAAGSCKALGTAPARISSETTEAPEEEQVPEHVPQQHQYIAHFQEMSGVDPETAELSAECSLPGGIFATGSKDHTIAIWDLFADSCAV